MSVSPSRPILGLLTLFTLTLSACDTEQSAANPSDQASPGAQPAMSAPLPDGAEALSLLGTPLTPPEITGERLEQLTANLEAAQAEFDANPESADAAIWVGRRLAYLGRYRDAIDVYTRGIEQHPDDARLLRHRGHRWLTVREFDRAIDDFNQAAELIRDTDDEVEPDGQPNERGIPTSTLHFNIWYHLGLAHYLKGDFESARQAYQACMDVSTNDDSRVATAHWQYMTLRRLGMDAEAEQVLAPFPENTEVIENDSYLQLIRMYQGAQTPEDLIGPDGEESLEGATQGYGIGNWWYYNGDQARALEMFERVVEGDSQWAAFGYIAAEAEVARASDG